MAIEHLTLPGTTVKKHNQLIRSKIDITSALSAKILACLIACIHKDDRDFKSVYRIAAKDILPHLGGDNYAQIKNICIEMRRSGVDFEYKDSTGETLLTTVSFFSRIEYRKGIIEATFNYADPLISECLIGLTEKFTEYNLLEYLKLPSLYSQRLFEIIKSWSNLPEFTISTEKLHHMLNTPQSFQNDFRQFRVYVLEKAHADITKKTSLRYDWEPIKTGRKVTEIRFTFQKRRKKLETEKNGKGQKPLTSPHAQLSQIGSLFAPEQPELSLEEKKKHLAEAFRRLEHKERATETKESK